MLTAIFLGLRLHVRLLHIFIPAHSQTPETALEVSVAENTLWLVRITISGISDATHSAWPDRWLLPLREAVDGLKSVPRTSQIMAAMTIYGGKRSVRQKKYLTVIG